MPEPIGSRTSEVLEFIRKYANEKGMSPTLKEIASHFSIRPPSAFAHVARLEQAGYIKRKARHRRSIKVIEDVRSADVPIKKLVQIPVYGRVVAGGLALAEQHHEGDLSIDSALLQSGGTIFALKVSGDSMIDADIREGDHLIVRQQPVAYDGDIVVALIGEEGTVKRLRMGPDRVELAPENPRYQPIRVERGDEFRIVGKAIAVYRNAKESGQRSPM